MAGYFDSGLICESFLPIMSNSVYSVYDNRPLTLSERTTYATSVSGSFWVNSEFPESANFPLWETVLPIEWDKTDISTLTVWHSDAGPSGAVVITPPATVYPYSVPLRIEQVFGDVPQPQPPPPPPLPHPQPQPKSSSDRTQKLSPGIIAGMAVGALVTLIVIVLFLLRVMRVSRAKRRVPMGIVSNI
jgi:hypothetical protein